MQSLGVGEGEVGAKADHAKAGGVDRLRSFGRLPAAGRQKSRPQDETFIGFWLTPRASFENRLQAEMLADFGDDLLRRLRDVDGEGVRWFFEVGDLTGEHLVFHVVARPGMQPFEQQVVVSLQIDQLHVFRFWINAQKFAVATLEGGAGYNRAFPLG